MLFCTVQLRNSVGLAVCVALRRLRLAAAAVHVPSSYAACLPTSYAACLSGCLPEQEEVEGDLSKIASASATGAAVKDEL